MTNDPTKSELHYLTAPYTHKDENVKKQNVEYARLITAEYINMHPYVIPLCPMVYIQSLQDFAEPKMGWYQFDLKFLEKADKLVIIQLRDWKKSKGISIEIAFAKANGIPIEYVDPKDYL